MPYYYNIDNSYDIDSIIITVYNHKHDCYVSRKCFEYREGHNTQANTSIIILLYTFPVNMHNNFLLRIYIKEGSVWLQHHSICNWLTYTIDLFRVMAEADSTSIDMSFPESIPEIEWGARRYCYSNGVDVTDMTRLALSRQ